MLPIEEKGFWHASRSGVESTEPATRRWKPKKFLQQESRFYKRLASEIDSERGEGEDWEVELPGPKKISTSKTDEVIPCLVGGVQVAFVIDS